ncbi:hypothetical protein BDV18DRAFT_141689 [Aspergillus unguis]
MEAPGAALIRRLARRLMPSKLACLYPARSEFGDWKGSRRRSCNFHFVTLWKWAYKLPSSPDRVCHPSQSNILISINMRTAILSLALGLSTLVAAADDKATTTTVAYFMPKVDDDTGINVPYYSGTAASIVAVNALETTLAIGCLSDAPTSSCSIKDPQTMIQGISTWSWKGGYTQIANDATITVELDYGCHYTSYSIDASCTYSVGMSGSYGGSSYKESTSTDMTYPTESVSSAGLLVTGGVEKLSEPEATETPSGAGGVGPLGALVTAAPVLAAGVVAML